MMQKCTKSGQVSLLPVEVRNYLFTGVKKGEMDSEELLQLSDL